MSRPKCEENQARLSVIVPLLDKLNRDKPGHKSDLGQAVAEAKQALEKPRKKRRGSASSTSKPRRQQAVREKNIVPSIEYSPRKPTSSPTTEFTNDRADDSDYVPSKADLADISMSSASNTPSRRSPRKHLGKCPDTGSSPRDSSAPVSIERQNLPTVAAAISAKPPSPSLWSSPLRQKLYEQDEIVELPRPVFEYEQGKKELRLKREAMRAEKRKEKGKFAELRSIESHELTQKRDKRKLEEQLDQDKRHKRQKSRKSEKNEVPQTSKQGSAQWSSKTGIEGRPEGSKNKKVQPSSQAQASAKAQHFPLHDAQLDQPRDQVPKHRGGKKRSSKRDCRESLKRREVSVPGSFRPCLCSDLPDYFTRDPSYVPRLKDWPVGRLVFFEHVKQISTCRGSIHPPHVVSACRKILEESGYPEQFPFTSGRNDSNPRRAQSSIAPPVFYGKRSGCQPDLSTGSSVHQLRQDGNTECSPSKTLSAHNRGEAVRTHDTPLTGQSSKSAKEPCNYLTLPNSLSLGQKRRIDEPSHPRESNGPPSGQENVDVRQTSKILPDASSVLDRPQRSFEAQRQRHQSAPVNAVSRNTAVSERDLLLPSRPKRHDNALQEISNNAILQRVDELQKLQRAILERLPAIVPTQVAAAGPVSAAAASATAPAQGGNGVDQAPARRRKKKLSRAERQLKFPKLNRNVPEHLRHTDDQITEIGRIVHWYERHAEAPEAFDYDGRLYAKYKPLLVRIVDGVPVWTAEEISRITR